MEIEKHLHSSVALRPRSSRILSSHMNRFSTLPLAPTALSFFNAYVFLDCGLNGRLPIGRVPRDIPFPGQQNLSLPLFPDFLAQASSTGIAPLRHLRIFSLPPMHASTRLPPLEAARQSSGLQTQQQEAKKVRVVNGRVDVVCSVHAVPLHVVPGKERCWSSGRSSISRCCSLLPVPALQAGTKPSRG